MRAALRLLATLACVLALPFISTACRDETIFVTVPAPRGGPTDPPGDTDQVATFTVEEPPGGSGLVFGHAPNGRDGLSLSLGIGWDFEALPTSTDLLIRVDPAAAPTLTLATPGQWCDSQAQLAPTGQPGEWRLQRLPGLDDCTCPVWNEWHGFVLAGMNLTIGNPGSWRVEVVQGSETPVCVCGEGCPADLVLPRGTVTVRAP